MSIDNKVSREAETKKLLKCLGVRVRVHGAVHENYFTLAPEGFCEVPKDYVGERCPKHETIYQRYKKDGMAE